MTLWTLVLRPSGDVPSGGWPLVMYNHGFHPNPPFYGKRTNDGVDDRPGDYYRGLPQAYARAGYTVVVPDYRGHNVSEGAAVCPRLPVATRFFCSTPCSMRGPFMMVRLEARRLASTC